MPTDGSQSLWSWTNELGRVERAGNEPGGESASRWANPSWPLGVWARWRPCWRSSRVAVLVHYHDRVSSDDAQVDGHIVPIACRIYGPVARY